MKRVVPTILKVVLIGILCTGLLEQARAQLKITGSVTGADTGEAIPGASVYISNTSYGTATDLDGKFALVNLPEPPFELSISFVGYKTQVLKIDSISSEPRAIVLAVNTTELSGVTIRGYKLKNRYLLDFRRLFLGDSRFASKCKILNEEDINFYVDESTSTLYATSAKPLIIVNDALGYRITYWLEELSYNYTNKVLGFKGSPFFEDFKTEKKVARRSKVKKWDKNRLRAYNGSIVHYMQSVYSGTSQKEKFRTDLAQTMSISEYYDPDKKLIDTVIFHPDSLYKVYDLIVERSGPDGPRVANQYVNKIKSWYRKPRGRQNLRFILPYNIVGSPVPWAYEITKPNKSANLLITTQYRVDPAIEAQAVDGQLDLVIVPDINPDVLLVKDEGSRKQLRFEGYLKVTYLMEAEEISYQRQQYEKEESDWQRRQESTLFLKEDTPLNIYKNGHYNPHDLLHIERYWVYERVDKLLPLNYRLSATVQ